MGTSRGPCALQMCFCTFRSHGCHPFSSTCSATARAARRRRRSCLLLRARLRPSREDRVEINQCVGSMASMTWSGSVAHRAASAPSTDSDAVRSTRAATGPKYAQSVATLGPAASLTTLAVLERAATCSRNRPQRHCLCARWQRTRVRARGTPSASRTSRSATRRSSMASRRSPPSWRARRVNTSRALRSTRRTTTSRPCAHDLCGAIGGPGGVVDVVGRRRNAVFGGAGVGVASKFAAFSGPAAHARLHEAVEARENQTR